MSVAQLYQGALLQPCSSASVFAYEYFSCAILKQHWKSRDGFLRISSPHLKNK